MLPRCNGGLGAKAIAFVGWWGTDAAVAARTLILGLDSLDTPLVDAMIAAHALPAFDRLSKSLKRQRVFNYDGMGEGVFWPSAATGATPGEHGRYYCLQFDPETYRSIPKDGRFAHETVWEKLDRTGRAVAAIDWPRSPAARLRNGLFIDGWLPHDRVGALIAHPSGVRRDLVARYGGDPLGDGLCVNIPITEEEFRQLIETHRARIAAKTRFCLDRLNRDWDLFAVAFQEFHDAAHYAWHIHDPSHPRHDARAAARIGDPVREAVIALDEAVGRIAEAAGRDCEILVLTGPGMSRLETANDCFEEAVRRIDVGLAAEASPHEQAQKVYRSLAPQWLRKSLSPLVRGALGPAVNAEYRRRRFFAVPHNTNAGCVRINLKGRERYGVVEPGADLERTIAGLTEDIHALRNADTGAPLVERVARNDYRGPAAHLLPDLFVIWRREDPIRRIASRKVGVLVAPEIPRTGDHTEEGALWASPGLLDPFAGAAFIRPHEAANVFLAAAMRRQPSEMVAA